MQETTAFLNTPMVSLNEIARVNHAGVRRISSKGIRIRYQSNGKNRPRLDFKISTEVMQRCGFVVGDRVEVLFGGNGSPEVGLIQLNPDGYKLTNGQTKKTKGKAMACFVQFTLYPGMPLPNGNIHIELVTTEPGKCQFIFPPGSATIHK